MHRKQKNVYQQTQALLCKNFLKKWRMKRESLLEWGFPILLGLYMGLFSYFRVNSQFPEMPPQDLGRVDKFNSSSIVVVYTPISNITDQIMNKTAFAPFLKGRKIIGAPNHQSMDELLLDHFLYSVGIVFDDNFSYKLKFFEGHIIPFLKEGDFSAHCWDTRDMSPCSVAKYWNAGFVTLQTAINAAIIQIITNHSVVEQLMSVTATNMKTLPFISKDILQNELFIFYCLLYFSSFIYFASLNVTQERKKCKELMKMMGLQDSAFWLSWGLIYTGFIFIISIIITIIITTTQIIVMTGFMVIFILFFLYGMSLIALTFLMSVLFKRTVLTNLVVFLLTLFWGGLGLTVFYRQLPSSVEWILSICSPFAFTAGMAQIIHLDYNMSGVTFPDPSGESYIMIATFFILAFDAFFYLILTLYFDKILPYGNERRYSPLFFLNSSSCFQHQRTNNKIVEKETDLHPSDDYFEPIAPEFQGKEAIRIRNVRKEYKEKSRKVEALKGLVFDIYEGQITAILGHSGAGKSSLLNILNGLSVPTEGSITIYNKNLCEMKDLEEIREIIGVCPQFNVQYDLLTVKENLRLFAKVRGIVPQEVEQEVQRILLELDIQNIQDNLAKHLSEGQKRKLTFGIAILGDPQVLLLDEPTTGLDPFSRHQVWNFLKERKADHAIVFSTNFMDEADILADRKVIMSSGRLKCAGSSVFLKKKWGLGYHLSLHRNETCDPEKIMSFINHHIPDAKLKTESKEKLVYTLPVERTHKFPDLFRDLDNGSGQGLLSYDISMSTLNEVFMKVEEKSTIEQGEMRRDTESLHGTEPACSSLPELQTAMSAWELWRMQTCAIAWLRFLKLKRGKKALLTLLLVFGIAFLPLIVETIFEAVLIQGSDWEFKPEQYFLSPGQLPQDSLTSLLIINNTESNIEDFIQSLKHQNIVLEIDDFKNRNGTNDLSYNGAIIVSGQQNEYRFSVVCNTKRLHCFPILMNIISNGLLQMFNHTEYIRTERSPFPFNHVLYWTGLPEGSFFLLFIVRSISPYIAMSSISDYKKRAKSQLWTSGLYPSAYWCGQALVDVSLFTFILFLMFLIFCLVNLEDLYTTSRIVFGLVVVTFGYATSLVFLTYVISFIFRKRRKNSGLWSFCFYMTSTILFDIMTTIFRLPILISAMVLVPSFTLDGFLAFLAERGIQHQRKYGNFDFDLSETDLLVCLIPYFQALLFVFVLRCLEMKHGQKIMQQDPVFRISPSHGEARPNPEEPVDEDEDVQAERIRTAAALTTLDLEEKPIIIASCLHKEYTGQKKNCFSKRKKKKAARNISFCVNKGEILGLLGPNGAGKSSSIRMVSGVTKPTAGEVELKGCSSVLDHQGGSKVKFLGYCPQENTLWPTLTVREHLQVFAAVKGLRKGDSTAAISGLVDTFRLHEQLNVPVQKLTAGATRKLCFMLSILGNSPILLLDEPSTGMDPAGQQQMWQMIQAAIKNTEKGALLATHYLPEAEAICDRIAIMVSGRLRSIGSIQHLESKLGKDYILELKVTETSQVTLIHTEIVRLFPQAARQERYSSFLTYKLPMMDVHPLSQAFHKLEAVKRNFHLEDYSFSQCTLERVFLELSKEQEVANVDEEVDTTMRWKLLSHSDDP